jgi:hypothetical protein
MEETLSLETHFRLSKARSMLSGLVDGVQTGVRVIERRRDSVALIDAKMLERLLAESFPFQPEVYFDGDSGAAIWLPGLEVFGEADDFEGAVDALVRSILGYVALWEEELRVAPSHRDKWGWVYRVQLAERPERIREMLFEEHEAPDLRRASGVL